MLVILFGVPWQFSAMLLGLHGPTAWRAPFILFGFVHGSMFVPLYFFALVTGIRPRLARKPNYRTTDWLYGVECKHRGCLWATPVCREKEEAYLREEIHTKTTGHQHYSLISAIETQLEVI